MSILSDWQLQRVYSAFIFVFQVEFRNAAIMQRETVRITNLVIDLTELGIKTPIFSSKEDALSTRSFGQLKLPSLCEF